MADMVYFQEHTKDSTVNRVLDAVLMNPLIQPNEVHRIHDQAEHDLGSQLAHSGLVPAGLDPDAIIQAREAGTRSLSLLAKAHGFTYYYFAGWLNAWLYLAECEQDSAQRAA